MTRLQNIVATLETIYASPACFHDTGLVCFALSAMRLAIVAHRRGDLAAVDGFAVIAREHLAKITPRNF